MNNKKIDLNIRVSVGERIRSRRLELGMTQQELANKLGLKSKASVNKYELVRTMKLEKIEKFAKALDCSPEYLIGLEEKNAKTLYLDISGITSAILSKYENQINKSDEEFIENYAEWFDKFYDLSEASQQQVKDYIEFLWNKEHSTSGQ